MTLNDFAILLLVVLQVGALLAIGLVYVCLRVTMRYVLYVRNMIELNINRLPRRKRRRG